MAKSWEKSFAVEALHRISRNFVLEDIIKDQEPDAAAFKEMLDISWIWRKRDFFEGLGLNDALKKLRGIRDGSVKYTDIVGFVHTPKGYRSV